MVAETVKILCGRSGSVFISYGLVGLRSATRSSKTTSRDRRRAPMTRPSCPAGALEAVETASRDERRALQRARLKGALRRASDHVAHYQPLLRCGGRASGDVLKTLADRARVRAVTRVGIGRAVARRKSCAAGCQMPDAGCRMQGTSRKTRSTTRRAARAIASIGSTRGRRRAEIRTPPRRVCGVGEAPAGARPWPMGAGAHALQWRGRASGLR
ncbi:hypothetical protein [Burkholderia pseudomallei]|uniref:hypothetical protein n=1 Tax=Burkholderia pseudomallei TaxID=28450 RepID=UPI001F18B277